MSDVIYAPTYHTIAAHRSWQLVLWCQKWPAQNTSPGWLTPLGLGRQICLAVSKIEESLTKLKNALAKGAVCGKYYSALMSGVYLFSMACYGVLRAWAACKEQIQRQAYTSQRLLQGSRKKLCGLRTLRENRRWQLGLNTREGVLIKAYHFLAIASINLLNTGKYLQQSLWQDPPWPTGARRVHELNNSCQYQKTKTHSARVCAILRAVHSQSHEVGARSICECALLLRSYTTSHHKFELTLTRGLIK
jgi:hypothetical protein